jgi:hypothetical protein
MQYIREVSVVTPDLNRNNKARGDKVKNYAKRHVCTCRQAEVNEGRIFTLLNPDM